MITCALSDPLDSELLKCSQASVTVQLRLSPGTIFCHPVVLGICFGILGGSHDPSLGMRIPLLSKHVVVNIFWVIPAQEVAMDTSLNCLKCSGPCQP